MAVSTCPFLAHSASFFAYFRSVTLCVEVKATDGVGDRMLSRWLNVLMGNAPVARRRYCVRQAS